MALSLVFFLKALKVYEVRMNLSVLLLLESDGSGSLCYYSTGESFYQFNTTDELFSFLKTVDRVQPRSNNHNN